MANPFHSLASSYDYTSLRPLGPPEDGQPPLDVSAGVIPTVHRLFLYAKVGGLHSNGRRVEPRAANETTTSSSASPSSMLHTAVDAILFDATNGCAWRCLTTLGELKPEYFEVDAFAAVLASFLGQQRSLTKQDQTTTAAQLPSMVVRPTWAPSESTRIVSLEVFATAAEGRASVTLTTLHCSLCDPPENARAELLLAMGSIAEERGRLQDDALRHQKAEAEALEQRKQAAEEAEERERATLASALKVINTKKRKLRELLETLEDTQARVESLERQLADEYQMRTQVVGGTEHDECRRMRHMKEGSEGSAVPAASPFREASQRESGALQAHGVEDSSDAGSNLADPPPEHPGRTSTEDLLGLAM